MKPRSGRLLGRNLEMKPVNEDAMFFPRFPDDFDDLPVLAMSLE